VNRYFWYRNTRHFSHQRHFYTETCSRNNRVQNLHSIQEKETTVKNTVTSNVTHTYSKRKWLAFWSYHKIELSNHLFLCFFAVIRSQSDQMSSYITCLHVGSQQITNTWTGRHSQCVNSDLTVRRCTISHICSAVNDKIIKTTNDLS